MQIAHALLGAASALDREALRGAVILLHYAINLVVKSQLLSSLAECAQVNRKIGSVLFI